MITISRTIIKASSWEIIKDNLEQNDVHCQIGDVVTSELRNGNVQQWTITDFGSDYIRFEARDCIKGVIQKMNRESTNVGGIASSLMQEYLDNDIWNLLPDDLQDVISTVDRKYMDGAEEKTYQTKLFLPSASEVFSADCRYGLESLYEQLYYYKDCHHRIKLSGFGDDPANWWLSSPLSGYAKSFCYVTTAGAPYSSSASGSRDVAPCFMIMKS